MCTNLLLLVWCLGTLCGVVAQTPAAGSFYSGPGATIGSSTSCPVQSCTTVTPACTPYQYRKDCGFNSSGTCTACTGIAAGKYFDNAEQILTDSCTQTLCHACSAGSYNSGCSATSAGTCTACNPSTPPTGQYFITPPNATSQCVTAPFPVAEAGYKYVGQTSTSMGTLTPCGAIASNLYYTKPVSHTENCVTAAKTVCQAGNKNVLSNSTYQGDCIPCTSQVNGTYWINNTAWDSDCPTANCVDTDCSIGQWKSGCTGTSSGTCTACTTANASQIYSTKGGWANTCLVANCEKICASGQYITGCGVNGATSATLSCAACTNAVNNVNFYVGQGGYLSTSCPTTQCQTCSNGNYRAGCGGTSEGTCVGCTNTI